MAQIFPPQANAFARGSLIVALLAVAFLGWALDALNRSSYATQQEVAREQPVPFSHTHHVGSMGIDCRYCHSTVEVSAAAGIPPTKTCMNCHSQVWNTSPTLEPVRESFRTNRSIAWTKVYDLPDFVYFNHSIHVKKGMGCTTCHGPVDRMSLVWQQPTLQMSWCLDCHRQPEKYVRPRQEVFNVSYTPPGDQLALGAKLVAEYKIEKLTACSTCHR